MTILFDETREEKLQVMLWLCGQGPETRAVKRKIQVTGITFGAALITRHTLGRHELISRN